MIVLSPLHTVVVEFGVAFEYGIVDEYGVAVVVEYWVVVSGMGWFLLLNLG